MINKERGEWDQYALLFDQHHKTDGDLLRQIFYDPAMLQLIGDTSGKVVLDAGSGNGYFTQKLATQADKVIGIDASPNMVSIAHVRNQHPNITYLQANLCEAIPVSTASVDLIVSNLVLQYLPSLDKAASEFARVVRERGKVTVGVEHPIVNVIYRTQELLGTRRDNDFEHAVDYFDKVPTTRRTLQGQARVTAFNRTLADYMSPFFQNGFSLTQLQEPEITERVAQLHPTYQRIQHGAKFLLLEFTKK